MIDILLSPSFLVQQIPTISLITSAVMLVIFSDSVNRNIVFPLADYAKEKTEKSLKKSRHSKLVSHILSTTIFILYCYLGSVFLSEYIIEPILTKLKAIITLLVIGLIWTISYIINTRRIRKRIMHV